MDTFWLTAVLSFFVVTYSILFAASIVDHRRVLKRLRQRHDELMERLMREGF